MKEISKYKESVNITAVERSLMVMETIYHEGREMGIKEIAQKMDEHQSTIYRAASTLVSTGYLYQNDDNGKYGLGYKNYMLGKRVEKESSLIRIAKPYADEIANEFKENVNVAIRDRTRPDGYYAITIYQAHGNRTRTLSVQESIGVTYECYSCSVGKVLMAFSDDLNPSDIRNLKLTAYTPYTISDPAKFEEEIERIRINGYGLDNQERELGLYCVSCPVLDHEGRAIMALSVSGYDNSVRSHGIENIVTSLKKACNEMSKLVM